MMGRNGGLAIAVDVDASDGADEGGMEVLIADSGDRSPRFQSDYKKTALSLLYFTFGGMCNALVSLVVHDWAMDMKQSGQYHPLPDIGFQILPYIPWAFKMAEVAILTFSFIFILILLVHKHRLIVLRRWAFLAATLYLFRCLILPATSLPVTSQFLECPPKMEASIWAKILVVLRNTSRMGMAVTGGKTCGDLMYSGHTMIVTLFTLCINEYTPRRMRVLHICTWVGNIFVMFSIISSREHYSMDVIVAYWFTTLFFLHYHSLCNTEPLLHKRQRKPRIWIPFFSYFEAGCYGILPNEYEWSFHWPRRT